MYRNFQLLTIPKLFIDIENMFFHTVHCEQQINGRFLEAQTYDVYNFNVNAIMFLVPIKGAI